MDSTTSPVYGSSATWSRWTGQRVRVLGDLVHRAGLGGRRDGEPAAQTVGSSACDGVVDGDDGLVGGHGDGSADELW
jgi:hypothetical protein